MDAPRCVGSDCYCYIQINKSPSACLPACLLKIASCGRRLGLFSTSWPSLPVLLLLSAAERLHIMMHLHDKATPRPLPLPPAMFSSKLELFAPVDRLLMPTHIIRGLILLILFSPSACNDRTKKRGENTDGKNGRFLQEPEYDCHSLRRLTDIHEHIPPSSSRNLLVSAVTPMGESV